MSLLELHIPHYDASERHSLSIAAPPARVWEALRRADLGRSPGVRLLLALRGLPARLSRGSAAAAAPPRRLTLDTVQRLGFALVDEKPGEEIVLGILGRFWSPTGGRVAADAAALRGPPPAGLARALWSFRVVPEAGGTRLETETRVQCGGSRARRAFRLYWLLIRPWSGWLRRRMLVEVRRAVS